jgi:predicted alpha/beta superfamily hydrolase
MEKDWIHNRFVSNKGYSIAGSSLGGLISCYAVYKRPYFFSKGICMSSSFWWNSQDFNNVILSTNNYNSSTSLYVDSGDSGPSQDGKA